MEVYSAIYVAEHLDSGTAAVCCCHGVNFFYQQGLAGEYSCVPLWPLR